METSIIKIGNSQGVIIPKKMLTRWGVFNKVQIELKHNGLFIVPIQNDNPRKGWEAQFAKAIKLNPEKEADLLDWSNVENKFDKGEWVW
jgi:antitoxin MazE